MTGRCKRGSVFGTWTICVPPDRQLDDTPRNYKCGAFRRRLAYPSARIAELPCTASIEKTERI